MRSGEICQGKVGRSPTHAVSVNPDQRRDGENRGVFWQQFGRRGKACIRVRRRKCCEREMTRPLGGEPRIPVLRLEPCDSWALLGFGWALAGLWQGIEGEHGSPWGPCRPTSLLPLGLWGSNPELQAKTVYIIVTVLHDAIGRVCVPEKYRAQVSNFASPFNRVLIRPIEASSPRSVLLHSSPEHHQHHIDHIDSSQTLQNKLH